MDMRSELIINVLFGQRLACFIILGTARSGRLQLIYASGLRIRTMPGSTGVMKKRFNTRRFEEEVFIGRRIWSSDGCRKLVGRILVSEKLNLSVYRIRCKVWTRATSMQTRWATGWWPCAWKAYILLGMAWLISSVEDVSSTRLSVVDFAILQAMARINRRVGHSE
jgi:hypothetical protein